MKFSVEVVLLDAPTNLGLKPPAPGREPGVRHLPEALRARNLRVRLQAKDAGAVAVPAYGYGIDASTGVRNTEGIVKFTLDLADALGPILARGDFPLVLGGDCSLLLGAALALRRSGPFGLCFVDGHQDLLTPATSQTGGAAGMDLALACGVGPAALTHWPGSEALVDPSTVLLLGDRSGDAGYPAPDVRRIRKRMFCAPLETIRKKAPAALIFEGLARLAELGIPRLWLHLDLDVLDDEVMPAVDSRQPGGMSLLELRSLIVTLLTSGRLHGMHLTILDPERDPDGRAVEAVVGLLEESFAAARA